MFLHPILGVKFKIWCFGLFYGENAVLRLKKKGVLEHLLYMVIFLFKKLRISKISILDK